MPPRTRKRCSATSATCRALCSPAAARAWSIAARSASSCWRTCCSPAIEYSFATRTLVSEVRRSSTLGPLEDAWPSLLQFSPPTSMLAALRRDIISTRATSPHTCCCAACRAWCCDSPICTSARRFSRSSRASALSRMSSGSRHCGTHSSSPSNFQSCTCAPRAASLVASSWRDVARACGSCFCASLVRCAKVRSSCTTMCDGCMVALSTSSFSLSRRVESSLRVWCRLWPRVPASASRAIS
mmetsp:Transcript_14948/g.35501  ORF Transcript_14948/g.35501 Transcript_14948/m.35501 type:complete len:242 (+) Transcript_14948:1559-2284(+)